MSSPKIKCSQCGGTGFCHLPKKLLLSFKVAKELNRKGGFLISEFQKACSASDLSLKLDTAHHRISRLVSLGMLKRVGKQNPARYLAVAA